VELVEQLVAGVSAGVDLADEIGHEPRDAPAEHHGVAIRGDDRGAAGEVIQRIVRARGIPTAIDGAWIVVLGALHVVEVARPRDASLRVGARIVGPAPGDRALVRRHAHVVGRLVHAGALVAEVVGAFHAVVARELLALAGAVPADVAVRAGVPVVARVAVAAALAVAAAQVADVVGSWIAGVAVVVLDARHAAVDRRATDARPRRARVVGGALVPVAAAGAVHHGRGRRARPGDEVACVYRTVVEILAIRDRRAGGLRMR